MIRKLPLLLAILLISIASFAKDPCKGTTTKGQPCKSTMTLADGFCKHHSPLTPRCGVMTSKKIPCKMTVKVAGDKCQHHLPKPSHRLIF